MVKELDEKIGFFIFAIRVYFLYFFMQFLYLIHFYTLLYILSAMNMGQKDTPSFLSLHISIG